MRVSGKSSGAQRFKSPLHHKNANAPNKFQQADGSGVHRVTRFYRLVCPLDFDWMKRFTETTKWEDPWFRKLKPKFKAFFLYVCDSCDCAGVWKVDFELASIYIGEKISRDEALIAMSGRLVELRTDKWWIPKFISFQCGRLSRDCKPHIAILKALQEHRISLEEVEQRCLSERVSKEYPKGMDTLQEKEKEKEKEEEQEKEKGSPEGKTEPVLITPIDEMGLTVPEPLRDQDFVAMFNVWIPFRLKKEKPKDPKTMFQLQLSMLAEYPLAEAVEIVKASIRNNWQGLIRPRQLNGSTSQSPSNKRNDGMTNKVTAESGSLIAQAARATANQARAK